MTTLGEKLRAALDAKVQQDVVKKTIEAWDTHEDQIRKPQQEKQMEKTYNFGVSNNVMRETFNIVKRNPNLKTKQYIDMLVASGFKESSVTAVIYQLIRAGQIHRNENNGALIAAQAEYTPIKQAKRKKKEVPVVEEKPARKIVLIKRRKSDDTTQGIAALKADGGPFELAKPKAFHPSSIVDNLSVLHARELYDYLKKIFTGESK